MSKLTYSQKYWLFEVIAYLTSIGVPIVTAVVMFPEQLMESTKTSFGLATILTIIVSLTAFRKKIATMFENSTTISAWIIILGVSLVAKYFVDQMLVISLVGVASNLGATPLFKIAENNKTLNLKLKEIKQDKELQEKAQG